MDGLRHDRPLVSVMMPAFNSGKTVQFALASLIAQTYENWECVVVDDGSTDDTAVRISAIKDPRIRIVKHESNLGEAAARQRALEESRGELLAMLDSDDWYFPDKLEKQAALILREPGVTLVSCGMAVSDKNNDIIGIRAVGNGAINRYRKPGPLPVAHAPSLFRKTDAASRGYDLHLRSSTDSDFLRHLLLGRKYIVMPYVGYGYRELDSARLAKIVAGHYYNARGLAKFFRSNPFSIGWQIVQEMGKILVFLVAGPLGFFGFLIRRRSMPPDREEREYFLIMRAAVQAVYDRLGLEKGQ